jgi:hypothetical protein
LILLLVLLAAPAGAVQQLLVDDEVCNNAIPVSGPCPSGPSIQLTSIGAGVVTAASGEFSIHAFQNDKFDYFGIAGLVPGDIVVVSTTPLEDPPDFEDPDTIVGLFDSSTLDPVLERLCIGDDAFNSELPGFMTGFGSLCRFEIQTAGTYYVGITGWGGDLPAVPFDGTHFQFGDYAVTATIISAPEPGLMLQLAAGVLGVGALNKRRLRTKCRIERARAV